MKEHQSASRSTQVIIIDSVFYHSVDEVEEEVAEVEEAVAVEEVEEAASVNVHRDPKEASVEEKKEKKSKK